MADLMSGERAATQPFRLGLRALAGILTPARTFPVPTRPAAEPARPWVTASRLGLVVGPQHVRRHYQNLTRAAATGGASGSHPDWDPV